VRGERRCPDECAAVRSVAAANTCSSDVSISADEQCDDLARPHRRRPAVREYLRARALVAPSQTVSFPLHGRHQGATDAKLGIEAKRIFPALQRRRSTLRAVHFLPGHESISQNRAPLPPFMPEGQAKVCGHPRRCSGSYKEPYNRR
jgi:hypothetical protein